MILFSLPTSFGPCLSFLFIFYVFSNFDSFSSSFFSGVRPSPSVESQQLHFESLYAPDYSRLFTVCSCEPCALTPVLVQETFLPGSAAVFSGLITLSIWYFIAISRALILKSFNCPVVFLYFFPHICCWSERLVVSVAFSTTVYNWNFEAIPSPLILL